MSKFTWAIRQAALNQYVDNRGDMAEHTKCIAQLSLEFYDYVDGLNPKDCCLSFLARQSVVSWQKKKRHNLTHEKIVVVLLVS